MAYQLRYTSLTDEQIVRLNAMRIPNTDENTDERKWAIAAESMCESTVRGAERAIEVMLREK